MTGVQTCALPISDERQTVHMAADEEAAIRAWLEQIGETDPATISEVIKQCQRDKDARDYFIRRAVAAN